MSILIFHRVLPAPDPLFPDQPHAASFEALCAHLRQRFNVLPLSQAVEKLRARSLPSRALAITFDDGYADNVSVAAPILQRHGLAATIFVATAFLDGGCMFNDIVIEACRATPVSELDLDALDLGRHALTTLDERRRAIDAILGRLKYEPLDRREQLARATAAAAGVEVPRDLMLASAALRELDRFGIEIGAHTRRHPILTQAPEAVAWSEIQGSRDDLERLLGRRVTLFAYPNGRPHQDYAAEHVRMVREAGFVAAVSTAPGVASATSDPFQLPRFTPWRRSPWGFDALMLRNMRQGPETRVVAPAAT